jgi:hypothetical protein
MSTAGKVLLVDDLQPYQRRFFGLDLATKPDRSAAAIVQPIAHCGFKCDQIILDEIGHVDGTWEAIKASITEAPR